MLFGINIKIQTDLWNWLFFSLTFLELESDTGTEAEILAGIKP